VLPQLKLLIDIVSSPPASGLGLSSSGSFLSTPQNPQLAKASILSTPADLRDEEDELAAFERREAQRVRYYYNNQRMKDD
jgi:hypothetical protein